MKRVLLVDGDSILYYCSKEDIEVSIENVRNIVEDMKENTNCSDSFIFLSEGKYFRHDINVEYKSKRGKSLLRYLKTLRGFLKEEYGAITYKGLEADDIISWIMWEIAVPLKEKGIELVYASPDKDVLKTVPGENYNYKNGESGSVRPGEANAFLLLQTLMGDSTDNIKGIPGVGKVKAKNMISGAFDFRKGLQKVLDEYVEHYCVKEKEQVGTAVYYFQQNFRQVYLLRSSEEVAREVGYIPELPEILQL